MIRSGYYSFANVCMRSATYIITKHDRSHRGEGNGCGILFIFDTSELDSTHQTHICVRNTHAGGQLTNMIAKPRETRKAVYADQREDILDPGSTLKAATSLARYGQGRRSGDLT